jgi:hypothetical protein
MGVIIYCTPGAWGPGKGAPLEPAEVDENFYGLDQRVGSLETNPPQPVSIDHFVIEGTLLTIVLTDGTEHGPFVLPIGQWRWTGQWQPLTQYFVGDIVSDSGNLYFVRVQHISEDTFDPGLFGSEGEVYVLVLTTPEGPYDIAFYFRDRVVSDGEVLGLHLLARAVEVPADFAGAVAMLTVAPTTSNITLPIFHNNTQIGSLTFLIGDTAGIFTGVGIPSPLPSPPPAPIAFAIGDTLDIRSPAESDDTAKGLAVTIPAVVPESA